MLACARCRKNPCSCGVDPVLDPEVIVARIAAIRASAIELSPEYVAWLDGEGDEPEPAVSPDVRTQIFALVREVDLLLGAGRLARP